MRTPVARRLGDGGRGLLRLGAAVARRVERAGDLHRVAGYLALNSAALSIPAFDLVAFQIAVPALVIGEGFLVGAGEDDARALEAPFSRPVRRLRSAQMRSDSAMKALRAGRAWKCAPSPICAGLFVADPALLAERDPQAPLSQFQRGGVPMIPPPMTTTSPPWASRHRHGRERHKDRAYQRIPQAGN